ncbi:hypothetical protein AC1031_002634 [Aphanomyces cochlioides]|nr:hypothetical protein AC1031_002634 [Aphanomyces cochlioides]
MIRQRCHFRFFFGPSVMLGRLLRGSSLPATSRTLSSVWRSVHTSSNRPLIAVLKPVDDAIQVDWEDGFSAKFHRAWLRDNCTCVSCRHPTTLQRQILTAKIPLHPTGNAQIEQDGALAIQWDDAVEGSDCKHSIFSAEWLRDHAYAKESGYNQHFRQQRTDKKTLWGAKDFKFPTTTYESVMDEGFRDSMQQLQEFGVILIKNTPSTMDDTEKFARKIGFVMETIYGGMWTTRPADPENSYKDTASTNLALGPHTDCTYLYEPPGLQIFNCVRQAAAEGEGSSRFVDSFFVVEWLRENAPDAYKFFCETALPAYCLDDDVSLHVMKPMIQLDAHGQVESFRFNDYDRAPLTHLSFDQVGAYYKHHKTLWRAISENEVVHKMDVGDMIVVDNHRVMHGRHAFHGERALVGCYIGRSEYDSRLRTLGLL